VTPSNRWRRIEEVFQSAIDMTEDRRDAFLHAACGADAELLHEVRSLLARDNVDSRTIAAIVDSAAASVIHDGAPPDVMDGAQLGNYRIIREIGRGGMGAVYLAVRSDQTFDKQVAIKLVKRGIDTDAVLKRFWYERRILAALEHPYIARLVDGGTSPDGRPYFVMDYIDGQPLDAYCRERQLSINRRCELFRKICEAVSYAHRSLVIHRDLKPSNVLVTAEGVPKLLDFGIARLLSVDADEDTIAGTAGGVAGSRALTPDFASPEQLRGEAVTTATDVYSLGATLRAILPAAASLPSDLSAIVGKATREEIEQRFASVADFSEDLRRYLAGLPIVARHQTLTNRAAKFMRRHRTGVAVFAAFTLVALAGVAAIVRESREARIGRAVAEQRLSQAVEMANRTLSDLNGSIGKLPGTTEARRQMVRNTMEYLDRLAKDTGNDPRVLMALATAYVRVGEVLGNSNSSNLGDLPGSLGSYQKALDVIGPLLTADPGNRKVQSLAATAHQGKGDVLDALGRSPEAVKEDRTAVAIADLVLAADPANPEAQYQSIEAHYAVDWLIYVTQPAECERDAREQLPRAIQLAAAQPQNLDAQIALANIYSLIGTALDRADHVKEALDFFAKAIGVREAAFQKDPRNTRVMRDLMMGYGHAGDLLGSPILVSLGDYKNALTYYDKAAQLAETMTRADSSDKRASYDLGMVRTRIGATLDAAGDAKGAVRVLDQAIAEFEPLVALSPSSATYVHGLAMACEFRGRAAWLSGDIATALSFYNRSLKDTEKLLLVRPSDQPALRQQVHDKGPIAVLLAISGRRADAIRTADELLAEVKTLPPSYLGRAWSWYARTYEQLKDFRTAATAFAQAAENLGKEPGAAFSPPVQAELREAQRKAEEYRQRQ
jgi:eukaryotic-like serine/threonine-protein kinase